VRARCRQVKGSGIDTAGSERHGGNSFLVSSRAAAVAEHEMMMIIISEILRLRSDSDAFQQFLRLPTWFGLSRLPAARKSPGTAPETGTLTDVHREEIIARF
jgi:hypothetical protein